MKGNEYFKNYRREKMTRIELAITDSDMVAWLEKKASKASYIKGLIATDMAKNGIITSDWIHNPIGKGTAGTYSKQGYTIFCNGDEWLIIKPDGQQYATGYKTVESAKNKVDKILNK